MPGWCGAEEPAGVPAATRVVVEALGLPHWPRNPVGLALLEVRNEVVSEEAVAPRRPCHRCDRLDR